MSGKWQDQPGKFINRDRLLGELQEKYNAIEGLRGYSVSQIEGKKDAMADIMRLVLEAPSEPADIEISQWRHRPMPWVPIEVPTLEEWREDDPVWNRAILYGDRYELLPLRVRVSMLGKQAVGAVFVQKGALWGIEPKLCEIVQGFMEDVAKFGYRNFVDGAEGNGVD